ncbi:PREDICTED: vicilin-like seed storage protein At2g18540 [Ipomoea nil]|uniref:vicilin-like seed storage protein At2g18540 n=1 Tax=Ipomoea nil TaxID=35883 RepID=UPI0009014F43|nr:PREDICTED: vicilin-like seed storage protein At2g18540 [Ipomoea nil]
MQLNRIQRYRVDANKKKRIQKKKLNERRLKEDQDELSRREQLPLPNLTETVKRKRTDDEMQVKRFQRYGVLLCFSFLLLNLMNVLIYVKEESEDQLSRCREQLERVPLPDLTETVKRKRTDDEMQEESEDQLSRRREQLERVPLPDLTETVKRKRTDDEMQEESEDQLSRRREQLERVPLPDLTESRRREQLERVPLPDLTEMVSDDEMQEELSRRREQLPLPTNDSWIDSVVQEMHEAMERKRIYKRQERQRRWTRRKSGEHRLRKNWEEFECNEKEKREKRKKKEKEKLSVFAH